MVELTGRLNQCARCSVRTPCKEHATWSRPVRSFTSLLTLSRGICVGYHAMGLLSIRWHPSTASVREDKTPELSCACRGGKPRPRSTRTPSEPEHPVFSSLPVPMALSGHWMPTEHPGGTAGRRATMTLRIT